MKKIVTDNRFLIGAFIILVFIPSFILGFHNATLYNPRHGFDGIDHVYYIKYVFQNKKIPPPNLGKETHQPQLYYAVGALLMSITGTWKTAQYINIFVLWLIIGMVGIGLYKVFKKTDQILIGMFSLAALPMLNIFPAMITNELLNTFWIVSAAISALYIALSRSKKELMRNSLWFSASFILGSWTKASIILIIPAVICSYMLNKKVLSFVFFLTIIVTSFLSLPMFVRSVVSNSSSNIVVHALTQKYRFRPIEYYFRLDWIPNVDMYNTQYYSLLGAAWNSFWTDGHNAITPFVKFHKKSFILWSLGFILLPISIYGLFKLFLMNKKTFIMMIVIAGTMLFSYVYTNINGHYSGARLTYEMGIVFPYAFGIATASKNKKLKMFLLIALSIQFITMLSFYWIQPWWHVTK